MSAVFCSNVVKANSDLYFWLRGQFAYFSHTWSLSVEIQFYIIAPLLFLMFEHLNKVHKALKFVLIALIGVGSFAAQSLLTGDQAHMFLVSRLWQFMFGFGAFYLYDSGLLDFEKLVKCVVGNQKEPKTLKQKVLRFLGCVFVEVSKTKFIIFLVGILFLEGVRDFTGQLQRLGVVVLTALIMSERKPCILLTSKVLNALGDCSYSVYLIHWPVFVLHRYHYPELYIHSHTYPTYIVGFQLICVSFVLGYIVEEMFRTLMKYIRTWTTLLVTVGIFAALVGVLLFVIKKREPSLTIKHYLRLKEIAQVESDIERLYLLHKENNTDVVFDKAEVTKINMGIHLYDAKFFGCRNTTRTLPIKNKSLMQMISTYCHNEGLGKKTIVIIGNSHAKTLFPGIAQQFRHIYKHLTLFELEYCMPFFADQTTENTYADAQLRLSPFWLNQSEHCIDFERNLLKILKEWNEPIDIIIPSFEFYNHLNPPFDEKERMKDDYFKQMQHFYRELNSIAREVVFVPNIHVDWSVEPYIQLLQNRLYFGRDLKLFGSTLQEQRTRLENVRQRVNFIECTKCIKIDWLDAWCLDNECNALSAQNISFFADSVHVNSLGARFYGDLLLDLYRKQVDT
ncbi:Acyl-transf-3 domain-containing protein [Aphelenchoides bicaudatus]|nr:Acyl-transf-3 domain-containing protein [Aphelenchoides bicaudatus]